MLLFWTCVLILHIVIIRKIFRRTLDKTNIISAKDLGFKLMTFNCGFVLTIFEYMAYRQIFG